MIITTAFYLDKRRLDTLSFYFVVAVLLYCCTVYSDFYYLSLQSEVKLGDVHAVGHHSFHWLCIFKLVDRPFLLSVHEIILCVADGQVLCDPGSRAKKKKIKKNVRNRSPIHEVQVYILKKNDPKKKRALPPCPYLSPQCQCPCEVRACNEDA